jgi:hypothetical protein
MLPYKVRPTVEILYSLFGNQPYETTRSGVLPAEFVPDASAPVRVFVADIKPNKQPFISAGAEFNTVR